MTEPADMPAEPVRDLRPTIGKARRTMVWPMLFLVVGAAGIILFLVLRTHGVAATTPADFGARDSDALIGSSPPPLQLPPPVRPVEPPVARVLADRLPIPVYSTPPAAIGMSRNGVFAPPTPSVNTGQPRSDTREVFLPPSTATASGATGANGQALVIDVTQADVAPPAAADVAAAPVSRASLLRNRATLVAAGTLIPAVLESGLDTSQPGYARAVVTQDVASFDRSRILIPEGSRLIGEYRSDLAAGQKRAMLTWTRLIRPDGVSVTLAAPATDPLGRTGVRGKVDTHAWARFGDAILRTVLEVGGNIASARIGNAPVIVGLPGSIGGSVGQAVGGGRPVAPPTIVVKPGTVVSVFVNRDLDFSRVEARR